MTTITYASMVNDIGAFVPGCPNLTIERTIRKIVIDLCQRGKVWREQLPDIAVTAGDYTYSVASPYAYAEFCDFISGDFTVTSSGNKSSVYWKAYDTVVAQYPAWPQDMEGTPTVVTTKILGELRLAPVPDEAGTLALYGVLRPTRDSDVWVAELYAEFARCIFHGVLCELMGMPGRAWSSEKESVKHGKQWTYLLYEAKDRAQRGFNKADLSVKMRPFA